MRQKNDFLLYLVLLTGYRWLISLFSVTFSLIKVVKIFEKAQDFKHKYEPTELL